MAKSQLNCSSLEELRAAQFELHRELMNTCRRYLPVVGLPTVIGIIDMVKNESIDLEAATRQRVDKENTSEDNFDSF